VSCPTEGRLAAAASGEDAGAVAHAGTCLRCARIVGDQREARAFVAAASVMPLSDRDRAELAAEVLARTDRAPVRRSQWSAGIVAVAATVTAILIARRDPPVRQAPVEPVRAVIARPAKAIAQPPAPVLAEIPVASATSPRAPTPREPHPAHHIRTAPTARPPELPVDPAAASVASFRDGWEALGAGRNTDAIRAFDRATDPVVAEDAAFWGAVAAQRAGDHDAGARRFREFLATYPQSPHADAARAALDH
jgi:hypothetical protein